MSFEDLSTLLERCKNNLRLSNDNRGNALLMIVISWVNLSREERCGHRKLLMKTIDCQNVSSTFAVSLINKYENILDNDAVRRIENIEFLNELYDRRTKIEFSYSNESEVEVKEATFIFKSKNINKENLTNYGLVYSPPCMIRGLQWKILLEVDEKLPEYLGIYLNCSGSSSKCRGSGWSCEATYELSIISQKEGVKDVRQKFEYKFIKHDLGYGTGKLITWNDILNTEKGYIQNGIVIFEARVSTKPILFSVQ